MADRQFSVRGDVYGRLHAFAEANNITIVDVVEKALAGKPWTTDDLTPRAKLPKLDLSARQLQRLKREVAHRNDLEPGSTTLRQLVEQIIVDALDTVGAPK